MAPGRTPAPTVLSSTAVKIVLQWDPPVENGGSEVVEYNVYSNDGLGGTVYFLIDTVVVPGAEVTTGIVSGRQYCFK